MDFSNWKWLNESQIINENGEIVIYAPANTDWFNDPVPAADGSVSKPVSNAPFYYTEVDGETYNMVRLFKLPAQKSIKVGIEAQSPAGEGGMRYFSDIKLEKITVKNLRAGI